MITLFPGDDIQAVVNSASEGTVFLLTRGVYHNASITPKDGMIFVGEDGAVMDGSVNVGGWGSSNGLWCTSDFPSGGYSSGYGRDGMACFVEDLYVDGTPLTRVATLGEVTAGTFFFDGERAWMSVDPSGKDTRALSTSHAFNGEGIDNVTIENLTVRGYANQAQDGAIQAANTSGWKIVDVTATNNHGAGLALGSNMTVSGGAFVNNGQIGIRGDVIANVSISNVEVSNNNYAGFDAWWDAGGIKILRGDNISITGCTVASNGGSGIWIDWDNTNIKIDSCVVVDNSRIGIQYEASYTGSVTRNLVSGNNTDGYDSGYWGSDILIQNSSDVTVSSNTVFSSLGQGIGMVFDLRDPGVYGAHNTLNNSVFSNTVVMLAPGQNGFIATASQELMYNGSNAWNKNTYYANDPTFLQFTWNGIWTTAKFLNKVSMESDGTIKTGGDLSTIVSALTQSFFESRQELVDLPNQPTPESSQPPLLLNGFDAGGNPDAVPLRGTISLSFNQAVAAAGGLIVFHNLDGSVAATVAASAATISGASVSVALPAVLLGGTNYYLTVDANAFSASGSSGAAAAAAPALAESTVELEFRTDLAKLAGTAKAETLNGSAGGDLITGLAGNDSLNGLAGDDTLDGGAGADTMNGGKGNDTYIVDTTTDKVVELANDGTDEVRSTVTYTLATNVENLTLLGTAAINGTGNTANNVLTGNNAANTLSGLAGADTLYGLGGNDRLDGGAGADLMVGGAGDDTYVVDVGGDQVVEAANEGIDTVLSGVTYSLGDNVENLTLTGTAAINGTGNGLDNIIIGNNAANTLTGGAGNDRLDGGLGNDTMIGGTGDDSYVVNVATDKVIELANEGIDTVTSAVTYTLGANVENLILGGTTAINGTGNELNNVLTGNGGANTLNGNAGSDLLYGLGGNDTLLGGLGVDWLVGGTGSDRLTGGAGADYFVFDTAASKTNLDTIVDFTRGEDVIVLDSKLFAALGSSVDASEFAIGTKAPNANVHLFYNSSTGALSYDSDGSGKVAAVQIATLSKGLTLGASDFLVLDSKAPNAFANAIEVRAASLASAPAQTPPRPAGGTNEAVVPSAETPSVQGKTINGSSRADTLTGTDGDDTIFGLAGNDKLRGGAGNDRLAGGVGTDELTGGAGADHFVFDTKLATTNIDRITDFAVGTDRIVLDRDIFSVLGNSLHASEFAIGSRAPNADAHVIYNSTSGALYYDADGSGRGAMQQFATLQSGLHLGAADFLIG